MRDLSILHSLELGIPAVDLAGMFGLGLSTVYDAAARARTRRPAHTSATESPED